MIVESRCGILCGECYYMEKKSCGGCVNITKPFWGQFMSTIQMYAYIIQINIWLTEYNVRVKQNLLDFFETYLLVIAI